MITCIKTDTRSEKEFFTVGKSYTVLESRDGEWFKILNNDNKPHYISYQYAKEYFDVK